MDSVPVILLRIFLRRVESEGRRREQRSIRRLPKRVRMGGPTNQEVEYADKEHTNSSVRVSPL